MKVSSVVGVLNRSWMGVCAVCYWIWPLSALGIFCAYVVFNQLNAAPDLFVETHLVTDTCDTVYT